MTAFLNTPALVRWIVVGGLLLAAGCRSEPGEASGASPGPPGGAPATSDKTLLVAAAQSLQGRIEPAAEAFRRLRPDVRVDWTYGGSGALAQQIVGGAPIDVFLSASDRDLDRVEDAGRIEPGTRRVFTRNRVVLIAAAGMPSATLSRWEDLGRDAVRRVAIGDPATVPAGMYASDIFKYKDLTAVVSPKLILGASVRQVLDYVARGEADAGVVFATDVSAARSPVRVVAPAPEDSHRAIRYPMAVVRGSDETELAREFLEVVASPGIQAELEKAGFLPGEGEGAP